MLAQVTRRPLPLILIRGFGGLDVEDERRVAYQGFNDGTVYPRKRGENYIYEGFILRFMKSAWRYQDATNVVGYFPEVIREVPDSIPDGLSLDPSFFHGSKIVIDPAMALHLARSKDDPCRTLWVFRYYDLDDRKFEIYGKALVRLIEFVRALAARNNGGSPPKVNIIAHSMGGLIVREAVQRGYPEGQAAEHINKIVTLGTPHQGISFQFLKSWLKIEAKEELERFNPEFQANDREPASFKRFHQHFPLERLLTIVGTNYKSYDVGIASRLNRLFSVSGEAGPNYNRSDGLVKQAYAQIPGAPRTFVHKCHGGFDSLVTARESFEIATRFFFGNVRARLRLVSAQVTRGRDFFGKSEFFFGVSIKPRRVDFDLFHQSAEAENCYGPFRTEDLTDPEPSFGWAGSGRLIWEGYLDTTPILEDKSVGVKDLVMRLDIYVGERDRYGIGFSDNVIFRKQYYVRAVLGAPLELYLHTGEEFMSEGYVEPPDNRMRLNDGGWLFDVAGTGFSGKLKIELDEVPEEGSPVRMAS